MTDTISKEKRSLIMRSVVGSNTGPERVVRRILHGLGVRFRLRSGRALPGAPDIVLPSRNTAVFVHGCFWHQHSCKRGARRPSANADYWNLKLDRNVERDKTIVRQVRKIGWRVIVVWECETRDTNALGRKLRSFLDSSHE